MKFHPLNANTNLETVHHVYFQHKDEIDKELVVDDARASFIIKTIMSGIAPRIYVYRDKIIKGNEILTILHRCFNNELVFTGKLLEGMNGKTYDELMMFYHGMLEERYIEVVHIGYDSIPEEVEYLIETILNN